MNFCKSLCFSAFFVLVFSAYAFSQQRPRVVPVQPSESQPINQPPTQTVKRPTLTTPIVIVQPSPPIVKKTVSAQPINPQPNAILVKNYSTAFDQKLLSAIEMRYGIPYRYGSSGPNSYDCSGFVWSVFQEAGFYFDRASAKTIWQNSVPVEGDDRFKFGTLVFFNNLGHIGIVADENGFYEASSSKGIIYSRFDGYWANRVVGFRRLQ
ncbi:MAG: C40 family peptidase [Pyrinomonadaceae bacterium]